MTLRFGWRAAAACGTALSVLAGGATARAAVATPPYGFAPAPAVPDDPDTAWKKPFAVMAEAGFGTPTGYYGLSAEWSPVPLVAVSLGVGIGSGPYCLAPESQPADYDAICSRWTRDLQYAAGGRLRLLRDRNSAFGVGAGLSMGGYTWVEFTTDEPAYKSTDRAYWANLEVSYEYRASIGFSARLFLGSASLLNPAALGCVSWGAGSGSYDHCGADHKSSGHWLPYIGAAVGWAF